MSGPKVVRIVTREEILAICHGQLARVDAALAEWIRIGRRNECLDEDAVAAATRRRDALAALIASDRFMDLQKQAPAEEAFLRDDLQARLAKVAAEQALARSRERRGREAAATLLRALRERGDLPPDLARDLEEGSPDALARGFDALTAGAEDASAAPELVASFRSDEDRSLSTWLARTQDAAPDADALRIGTRIEEIAQELPDGAAQTLRGRLAEAEKADGARRGLLMDALEVETGRTLTAQRRRAALRSDLSLALSEAAAAGVAPETKPDVEAMDVAALETALGGVRAAIERHRAQAAAASRRAAVLAGLSGLGYEVAEGMSTTLADDGRLVLRSAARPGYGVEVSAAGGGERMQMRPVAFDGPGGANPDKARDLDAETIWCGDVSKLQGALAAVGDGLAIEKALPVGAVPLKRVAVAIDGVAEASGVAAPKARTLR